MSQNTQTLFTLEWNANQWYVLDPDNANLKVPIDTALVDVISLRHGRVLGYIVAVHGLDLEWARHMDKRTLADLGVGAQTRRAPIQKARRGQLCADGRVEWVRQ